SRRWVVIGHRSRVVIGRRGTDAAPTLPHAHESHSENERTHSRSPDAKRPRPLALVPGSTASSLGQTWRRCQNGSGTSASSAEGGEDRIVLTGDQWKTKEAWSS